MAKASLHPALNGATITVGGAAGRNYILKKVKGASHTVASPCGTVLVYWPLWGNGWAPQPQIFVGGKPTDHYSLRLWGKGIHRRWGNM